jgi:CBS domain-containing protein
MGRCSLVHENAGRALRCAGPQVAAGLSAHEVRVSQVMTSNLVCVGPNDSAVDALGVMAQVSAV